MKSEARDGLLKKSHMANRCQCNHSPYRVCQHHAGQKKRQGRCSDHPTDRQLPWPNLGAASTGHLLLRHRRDCRSVSSDDASARSWRWRAMTTAEEFAEARANLFSILDERIVHLVHHFLDSSRLVVVAHAREARPEASKNNFCWRPASKRQVATGTSVPGLVRCVHAWQACGADSIFPRFQILLGCEVP